jgi:hypothetical protein
MMCAMKQLRCHSEYKLGKQDNERDHGKPILLSENTASVAYFGSFKVATFATLIESPGDTEASSSVFIVVNEFCLTRRRFIARIAA